MVSWSKSYGSFIFSPKRVILTILGPKVREIVISRTFSPQNAFLRLFRSKTPKTGMGREPCSSQCFFLAILGAICAKRRQRADFERFGWFWPLLEAKNCFCTQKAKKRKKLRKTKKHHFRSERQTVKNIRFWARFWGPKRPESLFSVLGQLFRSGAFLAPKAPQKRKMSSFPLFGSKKWKIAF